MYRTIVYLALVIVVFCILGIVVPQQFSALTFVLPNGIYAVISFVLSGILLYYGVASSLRKRRYKVIFGLFGTLVTWLVLIGLVYPTYFGLLVDVERPANLAMMLLLGTGYLIAALEYQRPSLGEELGALRQNIIYAKVLQSSKATKRSVHSTGSRHI